MNTTMTDDTGRSTVHHVTPQLVVLTTPNRREPSVATPLRLINNPTLSPHAKLLYVWLASRHDGTQISYRSMSNAIGTSQKVVKSAINDLMRAGYLSMYVTPQEVCEYTVRAVPKL